MPSFRKPGKRSMIRRLGPAAALVAASMFLPGCGVVLTNLGLFFAFSRTEEEVREIPVVTDVSPAYGPLRGGATVTVYGHWFKSGCSVTFDGIPATDVKVLNLKRLTCVTPAGASSAKVAVAVRNPDGKRGECAAAYHYWWHGDWPWRFPVTVTGSDAGEVRSYQVGVTLTHDPDMADDFHDVRFTQVDGGEEVPLPFWKSAVNAGVDAAFWVKVPRIPALPDTTTLYAYFGNSDAPDVSDFDRTFTRDVLTADVTGLWHLDEGSGPTAEDASGSGRTGWLENMTAPEGWYGEDGGHWDSRPSEGFSSGSSLSFDGEDDFVDCGPASGLLGINEMTVEGWFRSAGSSFGGSEKALVSTWTARASLAGTGWSVFDPGAQGVGTDLVGYRGGAFDGRYVYFCPCETDAGPGNGKVLRYDTTGSFSTSGAWTSFDVTLAGGVGAAGGYFGAVFDGRHVTFVPCENGSGFHAEVLRYDTDALFTQSSSWETFDASSEGAGDGYAGGFFDGRYVFFLPEGDFHGRMLRYDTQSGFASPASWDVFDAASSGVGARVGRYEGGVFDGRYLYCVPGEDALGIHDEVLRYDTRASFSSADAWTAFSAGGPGGYAGGTFDGRYVYFAPFVSSTGSHARVLRYDTRAPFEDAASWSVFDAQASPVSASGGYAGAFFDGTFVYFVPGAEGTTHHAEILVLDVRRAFVSDAAWSTFDAAAVPTSARGGYTGAVFDGRHVYFVPSSDMTSCHGEVLRYDAVGGGASFALSASLADQAGGFAGGPLGLAGRIQTDQGTYTVSGSIEAGSTAWHHVALTYDSAVLNLYLDGVQEASRAAQGFFTDTVTPLLLGRTREGRTFFHGVLDEVGVYARALTEAEIEARCERRLYIETPPQASPQGPREER